MAWKTPPTPLASALESMAPPGWKVLSEDGDVLVVADPSGKEHTTTYDQWVEMVFAHYAIFGADKP